MVLGAWMESSLPAGSCVAVFRRVYSNKKALTIRETGGQFVPPHLAGAVGPSPTQLQAPSTCQTTHSSTLKPAAVQKTVPHPLRTL